MLSLTVLAISYYSLHCADKLGKDGVDVVESCEQDHDVGARLGVSFREEA